MSAKCDHLNMVSIVKTAIGEPDKEGGMLTQHLLYCKDCKQTIRKVANGTYDTTNIKYTTQ